MLVVITVDFFAYQFTAFFPNRIEGFTFFLLGREIKLANSQ